MSRYPTIGVRPRIIFRGKVDTQTLAPPADVGGDWKIQFNSDYDTDGNQWPESLPSQGLGEYFVLAASTLADYAEISIVTDPLGERGNVFYTKVLDDDPGHAEISRAHYQMNVNDATGIKWNCNRGYASFYMMLPDPMPAGAWNIFWEQHEHLASTLTYSYFVGLLNSAATGNVWKYNIQTRPFPLTTPDQSIIGPEPELGKWVKYEVDWYRHPTAGYLNVWADGVQISALTGKTAGTGDRQFEMILWKNYSNALPMEMWFDDYELARSRS